MAMPSWIVVAAAILFTMIRCALAQDRPLLEPLRIGYIKSELIADRLQSSASLAQALRRKGFVVAWQEFAGGLSAVRSLHAGQVDIVLNIPLNDIVAAKRENQKMVFIAEHRSVALSFCDIDQFFSYRELKRYTLSGEYLADQREEIILIMRQEMLSVVQHHPAADVSELTERSKLIEVDPRHSQVATLTAPVTRELMGEASRESGGFSDPDDLTDINYWMPSQ
jgi:hypothetical protein